MLVTYWIELNRNRFRKPREWIGPSEEELRRRSFLLSSRLVVDIERTKRKITSQMLNALCHYTIEIERWSDDDDDDDNNNNTKNVVILPSIIS